MTEINKSELLNLTRELVDRPSENPPGNEGKVAEFLVERLETSAVDFDIDVREIKPGRPNIVARGGSPGDETLLLAGHIDVVPAAAENWTGDPFEMRCQDGELIGRGSADMKAAVAAKIIAAENYLSDTNSSGEVILAFVVGEERGGIGMEALVNRGVTADGAIIGEPTDMTVSTAEKGVARYHVTTHGQSAHSGQPDKGINAIDRMRDVLDRLDRFDTEVRERDHPLLPPETVTVTEIEGGLAPNIVPDEVTITVDWRFHPGGQNLPEQYARQIRETVGADTAEDVEVSKVSFGRATQTASDERIVNVVETAAADVMGETVRTGFSAITDARYLRHDAGIPTVLFGPGSIERDAHTVDESVRVDDLIETAAVYHRVLRTFFEC